MRLKTLCSAAIILFCSCADQEKIEEYQAQLREKDEKIAELEEKIEELESSAEETTVYRPPAQGANYESGLFSRQQAMPAAPTRYAFTVIETNVVNRIEVIDGRELQHRKQVKSVTNIVEIPGFNDSKKHKVKDKAREVGCLFASLGCEIEGIEVRDFESYAAASEARDQMGFADEVKIWWFPND